MRARCACGCPSVGLERDAPPAATPAGWYTLVARAVDEEICTDVILHVMDGTVLELEIWTVADDGEIGTSIPAPAALRREPPGRF